MTPITRSDFEKFLHPSDGICWWCREQCADSREHKFKASDLDELWKGNELVWVGEDGNRARNILGRGAIRRDRYGILRFKPSLCQNCNNSASQPYDLAYQAYSTYVSNSYNESISSIPLYKVFVDDWETGSLNLARYFVKHFGCRLSDNGLPIPNSMRAFLNGATSMDDVRLNLATVSEFSKDARSTGLLETSGYIFLTPEKDRISGLVEASFVRSLGVRFEWRRDSFDNSWQNFFEYPSAVVNRYDREEDLMMNRPKRTPIGRLFNRRGER